jgi:hypothetical protein
MGENVVCFWSDGDEWDFLTTEVTEFTEAGVSAPPRVFDDPFF